MCVKAESVDIEIDSGAEMSCLPANIGADTIHCTRQGSANCMNSAPRSCVWRLQTCEAML